MMPFVQDWCVEVTSICHDFCYLKKPHVICSRTFKVMSTPPFSRFCIVEIFVVSGYNKTYIHPKGATKIERNYGYSSL